MKILKNEMKIHVLKLSVFALATMFAAPALADHTVEHDSGWFEYQYNFNHQEDNSDAVVIYCDAIGAIEVGAGDLWMHDRMGDQEINGLYDTDGGGTWIYQESNDIPGLQIGGVGIMGLDVVDPTGGPSFFSSIDPYYYADHDEGHPGCPNSDTVVSGGYSPWRASPP